MIRDAVCCRAASITPSGRALLSLACVLLILGGAPGVAWAAAVAQQVGPLQQRVPARDTLASVALRRPAPPPARWVGVIGEYGWEHDMLYLSERDGALYATMQWSRPYPLTERARDTFAFRRPGAIDDEQLVITRDSTGRVTHVTIGEVVFPRMSVGSEPGTQLRITPLRPVDELRREALAAEPPREASGARAPDLVELVSLDSTIKLEIRYATSNNFLGAPLYTEARAFMQRPAAEALARVSRDMRAYGFGLLVHDAYRPWYVTKVFWDATPDDRKWMVADPATGSRHNRGCAVDLTLYDLATGRAVDMVSTYDESTARAHADYPGGSSLQRWHRAMLRSAMEARGFIPLESEWWHFDYRDWRQYPIMNVPFDSIAGVRAHPAGRAI